MFLAIMHANFPIHSCILTTIYLYHMSTVGGVQWLSGRVLDSRPTGCRFEPHWRHCVVSLSKTH